MTQDREGIKQKVAKTFDTVCKDYDCNQLRFFASSADELLRVLNLRGNERLIDIASGTGNIGLSAARILRQGHVTAIDLSSGMLDQARTKAEAAGLENIRFHCCDLESLDQPDSSYDVATCGFGIFFLPDMHNGLRTIYRQLAPGGWLAITTFLENMMEPLSGMFLKKIEEYGIAPPPLSWKRLDTPGKVGQLLMESNYFGIVHNSQQMGYYLDNAEDWWQVIWNSGYRGLLMQLPEEDLQRLRNEHLNDVQALADGRGIWMDVPVLFTLARV